MKVLVLEPMREPYAKEIDGSLESMNEIVGGWIETVYPTHPDEAVIVCNEEGKLMGLPWNRELKINGRTFDIIAGTCFICNAPADEEDFTGLTDEQIAYYTDYYKEPVIGFDLFSM